jgi:hypothetical protein
MLTTSICAQCKQQAQCGVRGECKRIEHCSAECAAADSKTHSSECKTIASLPERQVPAPPSVRNATVDVRGLSRLQCGVCKTKKSQFWVGTPMMSVCEPCLAFLPRLYEQMVTQFTEHYTNELFQAAWFKAKPDSVRRLYAAHSVFAYYVAPGDVPVRILGFLEAHSCAGIAVVVGLHVSFSGFVVSVH